MGKVSILKSFSLAAAVLCIVGISTSPASAKIKKANPRAATLAYGGGGGPQKTDGGNTECTTDDCLPCWKKGTCTTTLPADGEIIKIIHVPTNITSLNGQYRCAGNGDCPYVAVTQVTGSANTATSANATLTKNPTGNYVFRAYGYCEGGSEFQKGYCKYSCSAGDAQSGYTCSGGIFKKTASSQCSGNKKLLTSYDGKTTDTCVDCLSDSDCSGSTPACLAKKFGQTSQPYYHCVQCTSNSHCSGSTPGCLTTEGSTAYYKCQQCTEDGHCAGKAVGTSCLNSIATYGATKGYKCGCKNNNDKASCGGSGSGKVCENNACRTGCVADNDCSANASNKVCNTTDRVCRYPNSAAECSSYLGLPGYAGGLCRACTTDSHCSGSTPFCDRSTYTCTSDCNKADTKTCTSTTSSNTPICSSGGSCVQCTENSHCSSKPNKICKNNVCTNLCSSTSQCTSTYGSSYVCAGTASGTSGGTGSTWYDCGNKICDKPCGNAQAICMMAQ